MILEALDLIIDMGVDIVGDRYQAQYQINSGMGGRSFQGVDKESDNYVFMKYLLFPRSDHERNKFLSEIDFLKKREWFPFSINIICGFLYSEEVVKGEVFCLVTEWIECESLKKWLEENYNANIDEKIEMVHRICCAVSYIPFGFHHRDLHPGNIMIEKMDVDWHENPINPRIKIIDWGECFPEILCCYDEVPSYVFELIREIPKKIEGTFYGMPPEVFMPWEEREISWGYYDIWPVGLLVYKILYGDDLVAHEDIGKYIKSVHDGSLEKAVIKARENVSKMDFESSDILGEIVYRACQVDFRKRVAMAYVGRVLWDIRIEGFLPSGPDEMRKYLSNPYEFEPINGWKHSFFNDPY